MKVAVTGGSGFIGDHVRQALERAGHTPVCFDARRHPDTHTLGDVRDATAVTELAAHVDAVIHLAAVLGTQETIANPRPAAETNVLGTINVLEACRQYGLPMVNICVGNYWMHNTYSTTKRCAERLVEQYRDELDLSAANVRCVNAYGPGQSAAIPYGSAKVRKVMPSFVCRAIVGDPIEIYGDGSQISDMVHVRDVARTLVATVERCAAGHAPTRTVEVGPVDSSTVLEVARLVRDTAGSTSPIVHVPMRPGEEAGATVCAAYHTLTDVGIDPYSLTPIEDGVTETVRWFRSVRGVLWDL